VDFTSACADNGFGVTKMHWSSWTSHSASGYDTFYENDDYPDHAEGSIHRSRRESSCGKRPINGHPDGWTYDWMTAIYPVPPCDLLLPEDQRQTRRDLPRAQTFPA
jgi:hypothetical protein